MSIFIPSKSRSAGYARDRMKLLLVSERVGCSPQMMKMLKNDLIHTIKKYIAIDDTQVHIHMSQNPPVLHADVPLRAKKERKTKC